MSAAELRDHDAGVVIAYRRAVDYLESLASIDRQRIGFAGHSYGAMMAGVLAGVDRRVRTFVLTGGVACFSVERPVGGRL